MYMTHYQLWPAVTLYARLKIGYMHEKGRQLTWRLGTETPYMHEKDRQLTR